MKVQITVVVTPTDPPGIARVDSTTLLLGGDQKVMLPEDIVANAARLVAQRAILGHLRPTSAKEGGREG